MNDLLWSPSKKKIENSNLYKFKNLIEKKYNINFRINYQKLWEWSVKNNEQFWSECWDFFKLKGIKENKLLKPILFSIKINFFLMPKLILQKIYYQKKTQIWLYFLDQKQVLKKKYNGKNYMKKFAYFLLF